MTVNTFTRPGYADIRLFGLQFSAENLHKVDPCVRWTTGISADIGPWKREPYRAWFVSVRILGFGIGVCR